ncbi:MAG: TrkA family potassium uptake protein [Deferribacterales bacterium]
MNTTRKSGNVKKILIFGIGFFEQQLIQSLMSKRKMIVVDIRRDHLENIQSTYPELEIFNGDASSMLTWKKLPLEDISHIIIALRDEDIVVEACRIARSVYDMQIPIIHIAYTDRLNEEIQEFGVTTLHPIDLGIKAVTGIIEKNVSWPLNIGKRQGEIVEVNVLKNSHLVGRKLKYLRPSTWSIAFCYRGEKNIIPTGDFELKVGDKVIIVGEPKILKGVIDTLTKGEPQFPLQFGSYISVPLCSQSPRLLEEAAYLFRLTHAMKLSVLPVIGKTPKDIEKHVQSMNLAYENGYTIASVKEAATQSEPGLIMIPKKRKFGGLNLFFRFVFKRAKHPFILTAGNKEYEHVYIGLNSDSPSFALETGIEMAKLLNIPYTAVYVTLPKDIRGHFETENLQLVQNMINDHELSENASIDFRILEGNPVRETVNFINSAEETSKIAVLSYSLNDKISYLKPHVQYMIAGRLKCSSLMLPTEDVNEQI